MTKIYNSLFYILSCTINNTEIDWELFYKFTPDDWKQLYIFSKQQGIVAIIFEQLKSIPKEIAPPKSIAMKWLSHSMSIEQQMKEKESIAIEFANKLFERKIHLIVLKGLAYASYYPFPYHREFGDLDCYLLGKKEEGDTVTNEIGGKVKEAGYKHSHLHYKSLTIENHRYLTSFDNTKRGTRTEYLLQNLLVKDYTSLGNSNLLNPCADFNAVFLIKHAQRHFIKEGIRIRHLLDWAFFLKSESVKVDWDKVIPLMDECRILNFAKVVTQLCVENLGMTINIKGLCNRMNITDEVFSDICSKQPDLFHENLIQKIGRIIRRFYRMWKFRLLADESFFTLMCNNLVFNSYIKRTPKL